MWMKKYNSKLKYRYKPAETPLHNQNRFLLNQIKILLT